MIPEKWRVIAVVLIGFWVSRPLTARAADSSPSTPPPSDAPSAAPPSDAAPAAAPSAAPSAPAPAPSEPPPPAAPPSTAEPPKPAAPAPPPKKVDAAAKADAAERFERGLKLFDSGDNSGALAEFKRIYEIIPNPLVLYNIGLVYAAMGRPVDAVDALGPALKGGGLSPAEQSRGQQVLTDQTARIARLFVTTTPEGARIEIDNVEVSKTPLSAPLRLAEGTHVIGAIAEGYAPARKEVVVAGNTSTNLHLDLIATQGKRLANLAVHTPLAGADVIVDGERVAQTPLSTSITLTSGHHSVELKRAGYVSAHREIDLGEGATADLALELSIDQGALASEGGMLAIQASESPAELTVDGARLGLYTAPVRLPRGPHHLTVEVAGFFPSERDVDIDPTRPNLVQIALVPTPETRESHHKAAMFHRTWGIAGVIGGAVIAGAGTVLAVLGGSQKSEGQKDLDAINQKANNSIPPCDYRNGFAAEPDGTSYTCDTARSDAQKKIDSGKTKALIGYVGIGAGVAVAATGVILWLTGEDPNKYEHLSGGARRGPRFAVVPDPTGTGAALRVTF
jgi:hypothetical protein